MIVIVDDDIAIRTSLNLLLKKAGFDVTEFDNAKDCLDFVKKNQPQLILMDMNYSRETSGREGLELLQKVRVFQKEVPVILITGWGTIDLAVEGVKNGATDFFTKPWDNEKLLNRIQTAIQLNQLDLEEVNSQRTELDQCFDFNGIIGRHDSLSEVLQTVGKIAKTNATVLINGESGTGKELIAEAIHKNSPRKNKPFVKVNLGGISSSLFESEMFGHKKGAYTDAFADRIGRFEMANGGTIFLDEIGEMDLTSQVKLLRVLQEQTYEVLGDSETRKLNVRVVCATNKNLAILVKEGKFREDLYYRINLINITVPALRERYSDIPVLTKHFTENVCRENELQPVQFSEEAMSRLKSLSFPGNIRELKNMVERLVFLSNNELISAEDLANASTAEDIVDSSKGLKSLVSIEEMEKQMIREAMELYKGNISQIARVLGISRAALYRRFTKYNIEYEA